MQSDARFIKNIHDTSQFRTDLGCQTDALQFAARQSSGQTIKRQIGEAHIIQKLETGPDLLRDQRGNLSFGRIQFDRVHKFQGFLDAHLCPFIYIFSANAYSQHFFVETGPMARMAYGFADKGTVPFPVPGRVCFKKPALDHRNDPFNEILFPACHS